MDPDPFAEVVGVVTKAHCAIATDCSKSTFVALCAGPIRMESNPFGTGFHKFREVAVEFTFLVECFVAITALEILWKTLSGAAANTRYHGFGFVSLGLLKQF
jgi:hypothetical protein